MGISIVIANVATAAEHDPQKDAKFNACFRPADMAAVKAAISVCTDLMTDPSLDKLELGRIYAARGNAYDVTHNPTSAIADLNKAIELNSGEADIYYNRGVYYARQNDTMHAKGDFEKTILLDSTYWPAYFNLGEIYLQDTSIGIFSLVSENFLKSTASRSNARNTSKPDLIPPGWA